MHIKKYVKLGFPIIVVLEFLLFFLTKSPSLYLFLAIPFLYLLLLVLLIKRYKMRLTGLNLEQIDRLSGFDFEYFLYYLFKKHRIRTRITSYTHDFGADLILKSRGKRIVIQAKRWNENVGIKAVQETIGAMSYYKAKYGVVITNSFYTKSAMELAKTSNIVLINRYDLTDMIQMDTPELLELLMKKKEKKTFLFDSSSSLCPYCKAQLVKRSGRYGSFLGCSNYPDCTYTKDIT